MHTPRFSFRSSHYWLLLVIVPVAYISLFYRLGSSPVLLWDESRLGVSALEMLTSHNWLVTTFQGEPDLWSPKPPLLIWLQAALFQLFGANELTLRLPSALAGLATAALLVWFSIRTLHSFSIGLFSALVLLTTNGYVDYHITRNGDYDALTTFFITCYALFFFTYLETFRKKHLWLTGLAIALAILTKSVVGIFILPAIFLYTLLRRKLLVLLRQYDFYLMMSAVAGSVALYYCLREYVTPGYWQAVYEADLGGRLLKNLTSTEQTPWTWYIDMLVNEELLPWLYFLPVGFFALLRPGASPAHRHLLLLIVLAVVTVLAIISSAATKYFWYESPIYPFIALLAGSALAFLVEKTLLLLPTLNTQRLAVVLFVLIVFAYPMKQIWDDSFRPTPEPDLFIGRQIKYQLEQVGGLDSYTLVSGIGYNSTMEFYRLAAQHNYQHKVTGVYPWQLQQIKAGETILLCNPAMRAKVDSLYTSITIVEEEPCVTLLVTQAKAN